MSDTKRRVAPATAELRTLFDRIYGSGRTNADLGRLLGLDGSQVTRIIKGQRQIQRHEWARIEDWLGIELPESRDGSEQLSEPGLIPLYGWNGANGDSFGEHTLLGSVPRHPNQINVRGAFALKVADETMSPRYEPGETVYIAPNQWPAREQDCVFMVKTGAAFLRRFVKRADGRVIVRELSPERETAYLVETIEAMHAVVGRS